MSVRLTDSAAFMARWVLYDEGRITPESIERGALEVGANARDKAVLLSALERIGEEGVIALSHWNGKRVS